MKKIQETQSHMTLKQYFEKYGTMQKFFAKQVGTTYEALSRILIQGYIPSLKLAIAIEEFTEGKVSVYGWDLSKGAHSIKPKATNENENKNGDN